MTDKRLTESIAHIPHVVWRALEDGTIDNAEFARALADSPSVTSLLDDAAVGKAHAAVMEWAYRIDYYHGYVNIWTSPSDYERYDAIAAALGDES